MTPATTQNLKNAPVARNVFSMPLGQELTQLIEVSKTLASCPFYQKMGAGGVLAVWLTARELNLPVMMCLNGGLYTFDGKVTMSAQLMNMMIVNAGHRADVIEISETACEIHFWRKDRPKENSVFKYRFTIEHAHKAGYLTKDNWKKTPRDMLYSRCLSGGARKFMPDVLMNCYVFGEIEDANFNDSHLVNVIPDIKVVNQDAPTPRKADSEKIVSISNEASPSIEDFVRKHNIVGEKMAWVENVSKELSKTVEQILNAAIANEDRFIKAYDMHVLNKEKVKS